MTLPNAITLARLLAVPVAVWLVVRGWYEAALWLFLLAGLSDAVDGWLARRLGQVSRLGSLLDPVADKALLVSVFIALGVRGLLPAWLVILVVFRDALIVSGWLLGQLLMPSARPVRPHWTSKLNTCAQLAFAAGVLAMLAWRLQIPVVLEAACALVAATTAVSGGVYVVTWMRGMMRLERGGGAARHRRLPAGTRADRRRKAPPPLAAEARPGPAAAPRGRPPAPPAGRQGSGPGRPRA